MSKNQHYILKIAMMQQNNSKNMRSILCNDVLNDYILVDDNNPTSCVNAASLIDIVASPY